MYHRYSIRVAAEAQQHKWTGLLSILENLLPVTFSFSEETPPETEGEILVGDAAVAKQGNGKNISSFKVPQGDASLGGRDLIEIAVRFPDEPNVPFPYRARSLRTNVSPEPSFLSLRTNERPLATSAAGPVWAYSENGCVKHFRSAFALPDLQSDGCLREILCGERFLEMLPLLCWLREICADSLYDGPPLRACFIFDDPNLHWPSYGFVNYKKLAIQSERENYHISFATIPLDAWFTHSETASIFREHPKRLSLSVHGNNHTKWELGRAYSEAERVFLLRQAIQRIERLERRSGLAVSRVMVPPYGACSEEMLEALPSCGFEAACVSHGSLRFHNKTRAWTKNLGFLPSETIEGCPVLPRWGLTGEVANTILLAAFLKQAIVLRGHHQDLRDGIELLDDLARFINGLGPVAWSNLTDLSRSNYQWQAEGISFRVKPLGRKVFCALPAHVAKLSIAKSTDPSSECWKVEGPNGIQMTSIGEAVSIPPQKNRPISLEIASNAQPPLAKVSQWTSPIVLVRRLLTESRDRFLFFQIGEPCQVNSGLK